MKKGTIVTLRIDRFADQGKVLGYLDGRVVFVGGAAPGDLVEVQLIKIKKSFCEARLVKVLEEGSVRTKPHCRYFGACGGCKWQHIGYGHQLEAKRQSVEDAFVHHGGFEGIKALPTIGMEAAEGHQSPLFYRNKMEFSFGTSRWLTEAEMSEDVEYNRYFALGLHVPGRYDKILDIEECWLQSELSVRIVNGIRDFALAHDWTIWDTRKHVGYLRHLVVRQAHHTPDLMLNLVTNGEDEDKIGAFAEFLRRDFPEVTTLVNTINTGLGQTSYGEKMNLIFGSGKIYDKIGELRFEIAPNAFFQTNTRQAEKLYEVTRQFAELKPDDLLYDLYCGAGTISLFVAQSVKHVVGVELIEEAIENAKTNAALNQIHNTTFIAGDLMRLFTPEFIRQNGTPDVLIVDPPRAGMHPKVVEQIAALKPKRLVYVSCNPMTQVRDIALLGDLYEVEALQPVDMFPHTHHIESVAKLRLKE